MRIALIADIHANLEALMAVFEDIERQRPDQVISLGDNIGYGPDPVGVMQFLKSRRIPSLLGNHEWAMADPVRAESFNRKAREALLWTIAAVPADLAAGFADLPTSMSLCGCRLVHGLPPDNIVTYLHGASDKVLRKAFARTTERLTFVGHSHMLEGVELVGPAVRRFPLSPGRHSLPAEGRFIINIGSVGQPQNGDNRAKYGIYDSTDRVLTIGAVAYDVEAVARKIVGRGLPALYAERLRRGPA